MIPCTDCKTPTEAGKPCPNPRCAPPACPDCGRTPWHDRAVCQDVKQGKTVIKAGCGYSAVEGRKVAA